MKLTPITNPVTLRLDTAIQQTRDEALAAADVADVKSTSATSAASTAVSTASNAIDRVTALEAMGGLSPQSPVDGQTANLLTQPDTLTSQVLRNSYAPVDAPLAPKRRFMPGLDPRATKLIFAPHEGHGWRLVGAADGGTVTEDTSRPGPFSDRSIRISRVSSVTEVWNPSIPAVNLDEGPLVIWVHMPYKVAGGFSVLLGNSFADRWHWSESSVRESSVLSPHIDGWTAYELYPERAVKIGAPLRHSLSHIRIQVLGSDYEMWVGAIGQRVAPTVPHGGVSTRVLEPVPAPNVALGEGVALDSSVRSPMYTDSYKLNYAAGSDGVIVTDLNLGTIEQIFRKETVLWLKFPPGMTQPAGVQVDLYDDSLSHRRQAYIYGQDRGSLSYNRAGWVGVRLTAQNTTGVIGTPPEIIKTIRITALSGNGENAVWVGGIEQIVSPAPLYPDGVLTIFFDDGYLDTYTRASKVLGRYGFSGVLAAIAASVGNAGMASIDQLREMQDRSGWEIAGHSFSPNGLEYRFTNLSPDDLDAEMRNLKTWLVSNGFDTETLVSPGGQFSSDVWAVARKYFAVHRGVGETVRHGAYNQSPRMAYPARLTSPNFSSTSVPVSRMKEIIDKTVEARSWGTITFHQVIEGSSSGQQISVADLDEICAYAAASGVAVRTVKQVMEEAN